MAMRRTLHRAIARRTDRDEAQGRRGTSGTGWDGETRPKQGSDTGRRMPFESLDYRYQPSRDVPSDLAYLRDVLGARVEFAIEAMGTRVAMVELAPAPPWLLLADHITG